MVLTFPTLLWLAGTGDFFSIHCIHGYLSLSTFYQSVVV